MHSRHGCLIATTSKIGAISDKLRVRALMVRIVCEKPHHKGPESLWTKCQTGNDDVRKFASMKFLSNGQIFRTLLDTLGSDISLETIETICKLDHLSTRQRSVPMQSRRLPDPWDPKKSWTKEEGGQKRNPRHRAIDYILFTLTVYETSPTM
jgi:hypothetical protein